jgi:iron complex outermembrane recepter protein
MNRCSIWKRRSLVIACASATASISAPATAQQDVATESRGQIKVQVTGTNIPRSDVETALPVQVITREDIARSGSTTVAELMSKVSANILGFNDQLSIGDQLSERPRPGLSSVNLRGIGDGSTLVLVNGRRVANYAFDGGTVDVNSIPVAAIDRVEILKDGASAIYGTDAIAGVVNFILRKDFQGVEVTGYGSWPQHGGANQYQAIISAGHGDLAKDKFNVFVSASYQKDEVLRAADREFSRTGFRPEVGLFAFNLLSFPANIPTSERGFLNPAYATGCALPSSIPAPPDFLGIPGRWCAYDPGATADVLPPVERTSVLGRATFQVTADLQLFAEAGYAYNRFTLTLPTTPVAQGFMFNQEPVRYPAGGPFYPTAFATENGLSGDLNLRYRTEQLGNRVDQVDTSALRAVLGADGTYGGWDYSAAILYSRTHQSDDLASGYVSQQRLLSALQTGLINPFGPSGPEGNALLEGTRVSGPYHDATGSTWLIDGKASKDILPLAGGPLAVAVGAEARGEKLENSFSALTNSGDIVTVGQRQSVGGSRNVQALYAEASVPFAKGWESQLAARYDHYSDFGGTVNPKVALRWQPMKSLLLRTSWGTGFRAPTLYDLYTPLGQIGTLPPDFPDPVRCPVTGRSDDCAGEFLALGGGNPNLQPETSQQFNAGVVWEPLAGLSVSFDYWKIEKRNVISGLSPEMVFDDYARWGSTNVIRGPVDPAYPNLPGPIETVVLWNENLGNLRTSGYDIDIRWRGPVTSIGRFTFALNGTYIRTYELNSNGVEYVSGAGNNNFGAIPRWRHYASLNWSHGPWSATLGQSFQNGYSECDELTVDPETGVCLLNRRVGTYSLWDLQGQYAGFKNTTITLGIKNLFDRDPPFTQHPSGFANSHDATYADPRGRTYYASLTYAFK